MAVRQDPNIFEFISLIKTEEDAKLYAQQNGLLSSENVMDNNAPIRPYCPLGTRNWEGTCYSTKYFDARRNSEYFVMRCRSCKRKRS
uniref:Uncharacterized protein n=1 Tax=Romanomermis culicivorax TaxID=13658 RepID=A0A915I7K6_ROMCU